MHYFVNMQELYEGGSSKQFNLIDALDALVSVTLRRHAPVQITSRSNAEDTKRIVILARTVELTRIVHCTKGGTG